MPLPASLTDRTRLFDDKESWLQARRRGVSASDAPAILGCLAYRSAHHVAAEKLGIALPDGPYERERVWGLRLEAVVADAYAEETGREVLAFDSPYALVSHACRPWQICTPDRFVRRGEELGLLQIKTTRWKGESWNSDAPPLAVRVQVIHELLVTGCAWGAVAVLVGGNELLTFEVERTPELEEFGAQLTAFEHRFWQRVSQGVLPEATGHPEEGRAISALLSRAEEGKRLTLDEGAMALWHDREELNRQLKETTALRDKATNALKLLMGDCEYGELPDGSTLVFKVRHRAAYSVKESTYRELRRCARDPGP